MAGLERLLAPRSIAVIGGGPWSGNVIARCREIGFPGAVWPVHPVKARLAGLPAFPCCAALPSPPDAAFIGVNAGATIEVVRTLSAMGAGGAVCFASGFAEAAAEMPGGAERQQVLLAAAGGMPILGPNCYGFVNALDRVALWPDAHGMSRCASGVAIVTQSSNLSINLTMQARGLPIACMATVGNQARLGLADIGAALLDDPRVTVLGLHVEGIADLPGFVALAARARGLGKPVVVLKVGMSAAAQAAMVSHTASLSGGAAGLDALLHRLGIGRATTPAGFLETLKLLHVTGGLAQGGIASMSCSGGEAGLMADLGAAAGLDFPPLDPAQRRALRAALGPRVALANPLDYHTYVWGDRAALEACFSAMMQGDLVLGCVVLDLPRAGCCDDRCWRMVLAATVAAARIARVPLAVIATLPENMPEPAARDLAAQGVVPLCGMAEGLAAIATAIGMAAPRAHHEVLLPGAATGGGMLAEVEAKVVLARHGLRVPVAAPAIGAAQAARAAAGIGFPVVLKAGGVTHKTEAGAVALGLRDRRAVMAAAEAMPGEVFLVERMVGGAVAELLVGVLRDPAHGVVLTLGAGGVLAELMADRVSLLLPARRGELRAALLSLRVAALLRGHRGGPGADIDAVLDAVEAVQSYVRAHAADIVEVEVNPLLALPDGAVAVDALIRKGEPT